jgi:uncharacterized protein (DUF302 family)
VPHFDRLKAIGVVLSGSGWEAIQRLSDATAVNGLVNLFVFDPSPVIAFNGPAGNAVTYMTGNIVKAEVGLREHPACFLYLPLRVVIAADDGGEAELRIDHPVDLFSAFGNPVPDAVAADFCSTFAGLLSDLGVPVPSELTNLS